MSRMDTEFLAEDALVSFINDARIGLAVTPGLSLAEFARDEVTSEGIFVSCDEGRAVDTFNVIVKATIGAFSLKRKRGEADQLTVHRTRTNVLRETVLRDDLCDKLNGRVDDFTAIGFEFNGIRTYRTDSHIVSVVELSLTCCGSTLA